jgi:hypothetical protein
MTSLARFRSFNCPIKFRLESMNYSPQFNAIDIHEFDDGKIVRTWHIEDWMTGLRQLAIFEK